MTHPGKPRVLFVTPEITYLPRGMGNRADGLSAKAGGLADIAATLISALYEKGVDIHIALPDYRALFNPSTDKQLQYQGGQQQTSSPSLERIHLAQDASFYRLNQVYAAPAEQNKNISLAFQRSLIHHILPRVKPDLIHCNDWMTGFIPAMAHAATIPCLFTIHNLHTARSTLAEIEDHGIDTTAMWNHLYFDHYPLNYHETRETNPADYLTSGVFAARHVNTVSPTFLNEIIQGRHGADNHGLRLALADKQNQGCVTGILNAPDPSFNPARDKALRATYSPSGNARGKQKNKQFLQQHLGLDQDKGAALFFWPSRLDRGQKGCDLILEILQDKVITYREENLQIIFIADGDCKQPIQAIIDRDGLHARVCVRHFDDTLQRLAYGAADFILMPSVFEPCGLPQMIGALYGALPVVHDTGGLHDTVTHLDVESGTGNGFVFNHHTAHGLWWAMGEAMRFHRLSGQAKAAQRKRIMTQSLQVFSYETTVMNYMNLYEAMLNRPML